MGTMRVGEGKAGQFTLSAPLQSADLTQLSYDFMTAEGKLPKNASTLFGVSVLSPSSVSLVVISSNTKQPIRVNSVGTPIKVRIAIDKTLGVEQGSNWQNGLSCAYYVNAPTNSANGLGSLSFEGCEALQSREDFIECKCDHLTEFVAAIDPSKTNCGDGIIQSAPADGSAAEECDDGNTDGLDGCSPGCQIEEGAQCWSVGTKSECCAPCNAGSQRIGCILMGNGTDGICELCPPNTSKATRGQWDSKCTDCPKGQVSGTGATSCAIEAPCDAGNYRPNEGDSCRPCAAGTFKANQGAANDQCLPFRKCSPGRTLVGYSTTQDGSCELCASSTYKDSIGTWSTKCTPCPAGSSSSTTGNTQRDSCVCGNGYETSPDEAPAFCKDINECTQGTSGCLSTCVNTAGSFLCTTKVCGDGLKFVDEACDDGNTNNGDGCSSTCVIKPGWLCATASEDVKSVCSCNSTHYTAADGAACQLVCSRVNTCSSKGVCAADPINGAFGTSGGYCLCDRTYFDKDCSVSLTPIWSLEYVIDDITISQMIVGGEGFSLSIPAYGLVAPVTIAADGFSPNNLPASMQPPTLETRRAVSGSWRFVVTTCHVTLLDRKP